LFERRMREQRRRHEGGDRWIGTRGTSPFGNAGRVAVEGFRIEGQGGGRSALKTADARLYRGYRDDQVLDTRAMGMALRKLRAFTREGAADELDLEGTIDATARDGGELEVVLRPRAARHPGAGPPRPGRLDGAPRPARRPAPRPSGRPALQRRPAGDPFQGAADLLLPQLRVWAGLPHRALPRPAPSLDAARRLRAALEAGGGRRRADGAVRADAPLHRAGELRRAGPGRRGVADAARRALPPPRLAQSRAAHRLVGADHPHRAPHLPHVPPHPGRAGRGGGPPGPPGSGAGLRPVSPAMSEAIPSLELDDQTALLVLTGAGVSAESGLPTYRGSGGLWRSLPFERLASPEGFHADPAL